MIRKKIRINMPHNKNSIHHNKEDNDIRFYIAGYTKSIKGVFVQNNHLYLYTDSIIKQQKDIEEKQQFNPLPMTSIILEKEPSNKYDPNAILISAIHPKNIEKYILNQDQTMITLLLGYIPNEISQLFTDSFHILLPGYIRRFTTKKIQNQSIIVRTRIVIPYKQQEIKHSILLFPNRIRDIEF